jgi:hypothetical protein
MNGRFAAAILMYPMSLHGRLLPDAPPDTCRSGWNKLAASCL